MRHDHELISSSTTLLAGILYYYHYVELVWVNKRKRYLKKKRSALEFLEAQVSSEWVGRDMSNCLLAVATRAGLFFVFFFLCLYYVC
ncbi:hypothetical protein BDV26DRAFT_236611 [Aspergillus bertholletiae]|uniref:Uncharacterized protein n=1 Tax=Aspergillus bertholletiae TaxID=1226010 RepID=A0A5N7BM29_9EURO|nr:hypothetical protein BDV26DRAFT_236611 [Aspergillus bertholletiae]